MISRPLDGAARRTRLSGRGFTFLEIAIVLAIIVVVFLAAIPLASNMVDERALRAASAPFPELVASARVAALKSGTAQRIVLDESGVAAEIGGTVEIADLPPGCRLRIRYPGGRWVKPENFPWTVSAAGMVEPVSLRFERGDAWLEIDFDFLTGMVAEERYAF